MTTFELWIGNLARQIVRRLVQVYYPDIEVTHRERISATGPALFVANHANSLLDPVIIGISVRRPVHFLAKAPLFDTPVLGTALRGLGMIPAFRGIDDPSQIKRNLSSFTAGAEYLIKGEAVGLFPEGKSHDLIKVEQVRSGASRIAARAVQDGASELLIVPLGINYECKEDFRSSIWIRVGEPIHAGKWMQEHGGDERRAMRSLTTEIDRRLKEVVVHLNEESWEPLLHDLEVLRPAPPERANLPAAPLRQRKRIADAINYFLAHDRPLVEGVTAAIQQHRERLAAAGINIRATILRLRGARLFFCMAWQGLWALLGLVPATLGLLHHLIPFLLVQALAPRLKAPGRSTLALARLGLSIPAYAAWYFFVWRLLAAYFLPWVAWTWVLGMPFAGGFALHYCRRLLTNTSLWWNEFGVLFRRSRLREFRGNQLALRQQLKELADEYAKVCPPESAPPKPSFRRQILFRFFRWSMVFAVLALGMRL